MRLRESFSHAVVALCPAIFLASTAPLAAAEVAVVAPSQDTTIYSDDGTLSNGSGTSFIAGNNAVGAGQSRRALLAFDVAAALPAGATVTSATLTLRLAQTQAGATDVTLHTVTAAWGEGASNADAIGPGKGAPAETGDATWTHRLYDTDLWSLGGGDFVATPVATTSVADAGADYTWTSAGMAADVQAWLDDPASNLGWILVGDETTSMTAKRFYSREVALENFRPALTVEFTASSDTGACCADDGTCSLVDDPGTTCDGAYQGQGTGCEPNPCAEASGACCLPVAAATCTELTASECTGQGGAFSGSGSTCSETLCPVVLEPFVDALARPAVATPVSGSPGQAATYDLAIREFTQKLHRDLPATRVWGYGDGASGGTYPGPTIEATVGQPVTVNWINDLRDEFDELRTEHFLPVDSCPHGAHMPDPRVVTHLHGGHVPAEFDGYPESTLLPGEETTYVYPNNQLAATVWYHDHALGITRLNVYLGLAGFYLLRDAAEAALGLPSGAYEIPLAIQDRTFRPDGSLVYPEAWVEHFFGDTILVNGKVWPFLDVDRGKYRFRVLNGSNSRSYVLSLSDGASFSQIGTDGGLLAAPVELQEITLTPGERADLVIDFAPYEAGTEIVLRNSASAPFVTSGGMMHPTDPGHPGHSPEPGAPADPLAPRVTADTGDVMKFVVGANAGHTTALPATLTTVEAIDPGESVVTRDFELKKGTDACTGSAWFINGLRWDDITEFPELGTVEIWRFVNRSGMMHPMHMHLTSFQVLDRQAFEEVGGEVVPIGSPTPPPPEEAGWKDTVRVEAREIVRVIARFEDYKGRFAYHCHVLEHEDHEMMRQFETVDCGDAVVDPGEDCDLGSENGAAGACCSAACEAIAEGSPCDDDGDVCTDDVCDGAGTCEHVLDRENAPECAQRGCGDANGDGEITATDALFALNTAVGLDVCPPAVCDVNSSGSVNATDALTLLNVAVGFPVSLECPF